MKASEQRYFSQMEGDERQAVARLALQYGGPLRPAWLDQQYTGAGRLALSPLPGFLRYARTLPADIETIQQQGIDHVLCLLEDHEFPKWQVPELLDEYERAGLVVRRHPIPDRSVCDLESMRVTIDWLSRSLSSGASVLVHCAGGLGRTGVVAACYLVAAGLSADAAIAEVRRVRSPYAIETQEQEEFVRMYAGDLTQRSAQANSPEAHP